MGKARGSLEESRTKAIMELDNYPHLAHWKYKVSHVALTHLQGIFDRIRTGDPEPDHADNWRSAYGLPGVVEVWKHLWVWLEEDAPLPPVVDCWHNHHDYSVNGWDAPFQARIDEFCNIRAAMGRPIR